MNAKTVTKPKVASAPVNDITSFGELASRPMVRQEFGRRLRGLMLKKKWRQSDLARASGLGRDSISQYVNGKTLADPASAQKLADALGIDVREVRPLSFMRANIEEETHGIRMTQTVGDPSKTWVYINRPVSAVLAAKINLMLAEEDAKK
jgi:transcriptional regulator with XRE-family HTH domain